MEPKARVIVKKGDLNWAVKAIPQVIAEFQEIMAASSNSIFKTQEIQITVDSEEFLSTSATGGIMLYNEAGNILIDNTLEQRLKLLEETCLPQIRTVVFGPSASRTFFN